MYSYDDAVGHRGYEHSGRWALIQDLGGVLGEHMSCAEDAVEVLVDLVWPAFAAVCAARPIGWVGR
jgi:hypothetical protein